jgi:glycosyltransferase involved in cell wall biosynthesis
MILLNGRFMLQEVSGVQRYAREIWRHWPVEAVVPGGIGGHLWEQVLLPRQLAARGRPLLVGLCNSGPLTYARQVITIHDAGFLVNPRWYSRRFAAFYRAVIPRLAQRSLAVATVSEASKVDLCERLHLCPAKVHVIPNATRFDQHPVPPLRQGRYLLAVASLNPRKNLPVLLSAYRKIGRPLPLVLVGRPGPAYARQRVDLTGVEHMHAADDATLQSLYQHAAVTIAPSLYEGFGLPCLEALASGCPVIASDIPPHREVCRDQATYFPPTSVDALAACMEAAIQSAQRVLFESPYRWEHSARCWRTLCESLL